MVRDLLERLVAHRRRWLIVTAVTLALSLVSLLPQVDVFLAARAEREELLRDVTQAQATVALLPQYESRVAEKRESLAKLRGKEVDETRVGQLRSWIVATVRESGCQVRRLDLGAPTQWPWAAGDDPFAESAPASRTPADASAFRLERRAVSVSVTGSNDEVRALLRSLDKDQRVKHAQTIELRPAGGEGDQLQLDLSLYYVSLVRPAAKAS